MKKILHIFFALFFVFPFAVTAQTKEKGAAPFENDSPNGEITAIYTLYEIDGASYYYKLNTADGRLTIIRTPRTGVKYQHAVINDEKLTNEPFAGRFAMFSIDGSINYLLMDRCDGRIWRVSCDYRMEKHKFILLE